MVMRNKASRLVLYQTSLMYLIFNVDRVNISTAAPFMQKDLGLTTTQLGLAFSAFAYPYAFFQIAGGWLGDRIGPRLMLALCTTQNNHTTNKTNKDNRQTALFM